MPRLTGWRAHDIDAGEDPSSSRGASSSLPEDIGNADPQALLASREGGVLAATEVIASQSVVVTTFARAVEHIHVVWRRVQRC